MKYDSDYVNGESATVPVKPLATDPGSVPSWGNLGLSCAGPGMKAKAIECLDKALELDPRYELAVVNKAVVENMSLALSLRIG
jgi:lipoprotein NlpI